MARFFLHVVEGDDISRDDEGQEFPDLAAARREAINSTREIVGEKLLHGGQINGRQIQIVNEAGDVLDTVETRDVLLREEHFKSYSDDVTHSAPVAKISSEKSPSK